MNLTMIAESSAAWLALACLWVWIGWRDGYARGYAKALSEAESVASEAFERVDPQIARAYSELDDEARRRGVASPLTWDCT